MNAIVVKTNDATQTISQIEIITKDGTPTVIKAVDKVNYEFHDKSINRAPNHIVTKRIKNDLHVSFEKEGKDSDLIIEGFYDSADSALVGIAEDGEYYYYIPDTGETYDYVTQLNIGDVEGQALGGQEYVAAAIPWWIPAAAGIGLVGLLASGSSNSRDDDSNTEEGTAPLVTDDRQTGTLGQPVVIDVLSNDTDLEGDIDPTTVKLINPDTGLEVTSLTVASEGVWSVDPTTGAVTFTPEAGFTADPTPVNYVVSDVTGNKSNQATITVDYPPTAPNAVDEIQTGTLGQPVVIDVLSNDTDLEGDIDPTSVKLINPDTGLEVTSLTVAGEGEWSVDPTTGTVTFTPEAGFTADPTPVNYVVSDVTGNKSNQATITVDYPPTAPNAVDEIQTGTLGQPVVIDVLSNDTDLEGDIDPTSVKLINPDTGLEVTSLTVAGEGEWSVDPTTGTVTFTPEAGFTADPTPVNYVVSDLTGNKSNQATMTVDYPPTAPVAVNDTYSVDEDNSVVLDPLNADSDLDGDDLSITEINGTVLTPGTAQIISVPNGVVTIDDAGVISFTPDANFNGEVEFDYTITDGTTTATATETITVDPVNDIEANPEVEITPEDTVLTDNVLTNDTDEDGTTLAVQSATVDIDGSGTQVALVLGTATAIEDSTGAPIGDLTLNADGSYTFDPAPDFNGTVPTVNYVVADPDGNTDSTTLDITVDPVNDIEANPEVEITPEDTVLTDNVLTNDTDEDGTTLAVQSATVDIDGSGTQVALVLGTATAIEDSTGAPIGDLTLNADGSYTFDPAPDFNGTVPTVNYVVADPDGNTDSTTLDITVDPVNDIEANPEVEITPEDTVLTDNVLTNDTDEDGTTLAVQSATVDIDGSGTQVALVLGTATAIEDSTGAPIGDLTLNADGSYTFDPAPDFNGTVPTVNYVVADPDGNTDSTTLDITVDPVNDIEANPEVEITPEDTVLTDNVLTNDTDEDGTTLAVQSATVDIDGSGTQVALVLGTATAIEDSTGAPIGDLTLNADGSYTFDPAPDFNGTVPTVNYVVADPDGNTDSTTLDITVDPVNDAPVAAPEVESTDEDTVLTDNVLPNDTDVDGDILTVQSATVDIDGSGTQVALVLGTATAIEDSTGAPIGDLTLNADGSYTFDPAPDFNGTVPTVNYVVADPDGNTDSTTLDITVDPVNDIEANPEVEITPEDTVLTDNVLTNDTDEDGTTLAVQSATVDIDGSGTQVALVLGTATAIEDSTGAPIGDLTLNADGSYTFDPAPDFNGTVPTVNYVVADPDGNTDSTTLDITVDPVNDIEANPEVEITPEDTVLTDNVLTNDTDEDGTTLAVQSATVDIDGSGTQVALVLGTATAIEDSTGAPIGDLTLNADGSYTFDPAPDFNGTVPTVNYVVADPDGNTDSTTLDITVDPVNDAPVAAPEVESTDEDTVLTDNVLPNDTDVDGDILTVQSATVDIDGSGTQVALVLGTATAIEDSTGAPIGDLTLNADGSYTFDPAPDFNGTVPTVNYVVADPDGNTDSTTLDITVDPVNDIEANPEVEITPEDTVLTDNVLTNDTDEDGTTLAVQSATVDIDGSGTQVALVLGTATAIEDSTGAPIGDLTLNADGSYTFDPAPDFNGTVPTVNYVVADPDGNTDSTTLDITVDPVNDIEANPEVEITPEDTVLTDNVLTNDTDEDGTTLAVQSATVDIDGSGTQVALVLGTATAIEDSTGAPIGDLTLNADGSYTFDPAPDFNGTVPTVNYVVADPDGNTDSTTLDITVDPVNDIEANPEVEITPEDTVLTDNVLTNDTDEDGTTLAVQSATVDIDGSGTQVALVLGTATAIEDSTGAPIGDLTLNADGSYTFDPAPDFNGTVPTVNYVVADPDGNTDSTTLDITVDPVNDIEANPEVEITPEDTVLTDNVLTNDTDEDGTTLAVQSATVDIDGSGTQVALVLGTATAIEDSTGAPIGDLTLNADGSYTFDPAPDFNGTVPTVNYVVADPDGNTDSTTLDITVDPVNDIEANPEVEITPEDTVLTDNVLTNDTDEDGTTLAVQSATVDIDGSGTQVALVLGTATAIEDSTGAPIGDLTLNADGSYTFDPAPDFNGTVPTVNYVVADPDGNTDSTTLDITVDPVNDAPVAAPEVESTDEDTVLTDNVLPNDTDVDGDILTVQSATVDIDGSGTQVALVLGTATAIEDSTGAPIGDLTLNADGSYTFDPAPDFNGTVPTVNYVVADPDGNTDSTTLDITVDPVNDIEANPEVEITPEDTVLTDNVLTNDTDEDGTTLAVQSATVDIDGSGTQVALVLGTATAIEDSTGAPIGDLTLNADGSYTFDPAPDFNGTVPTVNYVVADPDGNTDSTTLDITVDPVNDIEANPEVEITPEDTVLTDNVLTNDTDEDGTTLAVQSATVDIDGSGTQVALVLGTATAIEDSTGAPIGDLTLNADGSYTFDPAPDFNGTVPTVNYVVADPDGNTDSTTLDITVDPVNDAPVAAPEVESTDEDTVLTDNVLPNDTDVDGDILTVQSATVDIDGSGTQVALVLGTATAIEDSTGAPIGDLTLNADGSYTFDPAPDFNGTVPTVNYVVADPDGNTDSTTLDITVDPVNDIEANPEVEITPEDTVLTDNVLTNDTDEDGTTLAVQSATVDIDGSGTQVALVLGTATAIEDSTGAPIGDLTLNADGSYTFDPAPDFNGTVPTVNYVVADPDGNTDSTTLDITVDPVNDIEANPEVEITPEDTVLTDNVLTNDTDEDGTTLAVQSATVDIDGSGTQVALVLGTATAIEDSTGAPIGDLTLNADGSYTFDPAPDFNGTVPTVNYVVADPDGNTDSTTLDITVNDAPIVTFSNIAVSEEGLAGGITDSNALAGFTDTTNRAQQLGTIVVTDTDLASVNDLSVTLNGPTGITSQGEPVTWTQVGDTLTGTATIDGVVVDVATVTIGAFTDNGGGNYTADYTTTLLQPIDHPNTNGEDSLDLDFTATVSDGIDDSASSAFVISVEDDTPDASSSNTDILLQPVNTNLLLIVDVSGSMNTVENGATRLQTTKDALIEAINKYEEFGDVKVRLVTFSTNGQAIGAEWVSPVDAINQINALTAGGVTNYDAALGSAIDAFNDPGKLEPVSSIDGQGNPIFNNPTNKSIFITDGDANAGLGDNTELTGTLNFANTGNPDAGIQAEEEATWIDFLTINSIDSSALSIINLTADSKESLDAIAYDGRNDVDADGVTVTAATLEQTILDGIARSATGNLVTAGGSTNTGFGADGGYLSEVDIDGFNYKFNESTGELTSNADASAFSYDQAATTVTITTATGGSLIVNFSTGNYQYDVPNSATTAYSEELTFSVLDNDGDGVNNTIELNILFPTTTGTAGNDFLLGNNDDNVLDGLDGNDIISGGGGADSLSGSAGNDIIVFDINDSLIDGGENSDGSLDNDTLLINNINIVANTDMTAVDNFETIDLTNDTAQTLSISLSDVVDITDGNNQLFIKGDSVDTVNVSDMTKAATSDQAGYDLYQDSGNTASLYIQTSIDDNII